MEPQGAHPLAVGRQQHDWSVEQLAAATGGRITSTRIERIEQGAAVPRDEEVDMLALAMGLPTYKLSLNHLLIREWRRLNRASLRQQRQKADEQLAANLHESINRMQEGGSVKNYQQVVMLLKLATEHLSSYGSALASQQYRQAKHYLKASKALYEAARVCSGLK